MKKLIVLAAVFLALAACKPKPEPDIAVPPPPPAFTAERAFQIAFGKAAPAERKVTGEDGTENVYSYKPDKLVPMGEGKMALVSLATNASDCHACSGAMAIHYFRRMGADWELAGSWPEIVPGNGFGAPPDWSARTDLGEPLYIVAEAGWTGQGYTCTSVDLIELQSGAPRVMGEDIPTHYDNEGVGTPPVVNIDGTLGRGPDGKLRVTFTGTRTGFTDYMIIGPALVRQNANVIDDC